MKNTLIILSGILFLFACKTRKNNETVVRNMPDLEISVPREANGEYRAAYTILHDIVHTDLDIRFDWGKQYLMGKATLTMKSHFYPRNEVLLDARGMQINDVRMIKGKDSIQLKYAWAHDTLSITTDKFYGPEESFRVYIDYVAKPEELDDAEGSSAISSDKGLYFINPLGKEKNKPRQIWTQGETESNSVWFPTIDAPNQKMTQELRITVEKEFTTLSNGKLLASKDNGDGTRTDTWRQDLPHAPYLTMMAIGPYAVVKDTWRGKEVNYYVEPEYERVARKIFGNTPEMLEFYSKILGVDYPWEKYSQVVVRDYVSGAMENTSATIHGEFLQKDERELLDGTNEDVIAHELFHHWFGDYITCESWSNLPLNESFATYGEYLWNEYKYGREEADVDRLGNMNAYFREAKNKKVDLIRFYYEDKEDMFDRHSYQKGGTILHMLRKYVGDAAFFASLKLFLETNRFKPVEVHHLRLSFEQVTGEDLNWFFNQWFLDNGHPELEITYGYDEASRQAMVTVKQLQDLAEHPLYVLPVEVDLYTGGKAQREKIRITKQEETFRFDAMSRPDFINFDAEKCLTAAKDDQHSTEEWMAMYRMAPLFQDRWDALQGLSADLKAGSPQAAVFIDALKDKSWRIRELAISKMKVVTNAENKVQVKNILMEIGSKDPKADVRSGAVSTLNEQFEGDDLIVYFQNASRDSSYAVMGDALEGIAARDKDLALQLCRELESDQHTAVRIIISRIYSNYGGDKQARYMQKALENSAGNRAYAQVQLYGRFLKRCTEQTSISSGMENIHQTARSAAQWFVRMAAVQALTELITYCETEAASSARSKDVAGESRWKTNMDTARKYVDDIKKNETNEMLLKLFNGQQ